MRAYIGIDPSISNTGLVILSARGEFRGFANGRNGCAGENFPTEAARYLAQAQYLARHLAVCEIIGMAYENYAFNSVHRGYSLAEFGGILKAEITRYFGRDPLHVAPMRLKKFAVGNGHADKEMMISAALSECANLPPNPTSDICDAYFLAKYAFYQDNPQLAAEVDRSCRHLRARLEITRKQT